MARSSERKLAYGRKYNADRYWSDDAFRKRKLATATAWRRANKVRHTAASYGMTLAEFDAMVVGQLGRCAICSCQLGTGNNSHVDHNHRTGHARAVLCARCNTTIGHAREQPEILRAAADYLERHVTTESYI